MKGWGHQHATTRVNPSWSVRPAQKRRGGKGKNEGAFERGKKGGHCGRRVRDVGRWRPWPRRPCLSPLLLVRRDRLSSRSTPLPKPGGGVFSAHFRALHRETDDLPYPVIRVPSSPCELAFYKTVLIKAFHCLSHANATHTAFIK